jgi:hypothetical protein
MKTTFLHPALSVLGLLVVVPAVAVQQPAQPGQAAPTQSGQSAGKPGNPPPAPTLVVPDSLPGKRNPFRDQSVKLTKADEPKPIPEYAERYKQWNEKRRTAPDLPAYRRFTLDEVKVQGVVKTQGKTGILVSFRNGEYTALLMPGAALWNAVLKKISTKQMAGDPRHIAEIEWEELTELNNGKIKRKPTTVTVEAPQ